jgi:hypothetical protein
VEDKDKVVVAAELEHEFRENPTASNGEKCLVSLDAEDTLSDGGSDNENSQTYYLRSSTITSTKLRKW